MCAYLSSSIGQNQCEHSGADTVKLMASNSRGFFGEIQWHDEFTVFEMITSDFIGLWLEYWFVVFTFPHAPAGFLSNTSNILMTQSNRSTCAPFWLTANKLIQSLELFGACRFDSLKIIQERCFFPYKFLILFSMIEVLFENKIFLACDWICGRRSLFIKN